MADTLPPSASPATDIRSHSPADPATHRPRTRRSGRRRGPRGGSGSGGAGETASEAQLQQNAAQAQTNQTSQTSQTGRHHHHRWRPFSELTWQERQALEERAARKREAQGRTGPYGAVPPAPFITSAELMDERAQRTTAMREAESPPGGSLSVYSIDMTHGGVEITPFGSPPGSFYNLPAGDGEPPLEAESQQQAQLEPLPTTTTGMATRTYSAGGRRRQPTPTQDTAAGGRSPNTGGGGAAPPPAKRPATLTRRLSRIAELEEASNHGAPLDSVEQVLVAAAAQRPAGGWPRVDSVAMPWTGDDAPVDVRSLTFDQLVGELQHAARYCRLLEDCCRSRK